MGNERWAHHFSQLIAQAPGKEFQKCVAVMMAMPTPEASPAGTSIWPWLLLS
jgi:hypothetical protein